MTAILRDIIARNRAGEPVALPSVCSAHAPVLRAALLLAERLNLPLVIEATSNQVNQDGGYTGMQAHDFVTFVRRTADSAGVTHDRINFGGDHLGPQVWRGADAATAMAKAEALVASYAGAGIRKIHLDCSEGCAGEPAQLPDDVTAARTGRLARVAVAAADDPEEILFVVGTEVPPPGGARIDETGNVPPTLPESAAATIAAHQTEMGKLWQLVGALVVQPGAEFSPMEVHHLPMVSDPALRAVMLKHEGLCLEAHSTDYQKPEVYPRLAALGFAFQKVGPALTYAWRRAVYALDALMATVSPGHEHIANILDRAMLADPGHWRGHYRGGDLRLARQFGLADRIRYYWSVPDVASAVDDLFARLQTRHLPIRILDEVFCSETLVLADGIDAPRAEALAMAEVQRALLPYFFGARP